MTKRWLIGTLTTSVLLWLAATGLQGAKPSGALPLKVDFGSATTTNGLYGDGLYIDGVDNVRAEIVGNFVFDTNDNARLALQSTPRPRFSRRGRFLLGSPSGRVPCRCLHRHHRSDGNYCRWRPQDHECRSDAVSPGQDRLGRRNQDILVAMGQHRRRRAPQFPMWPGRFRRLLPAVDYDSCSPDRRGCTPFPQGRNRLKTYIRSYNMPFSATLTAQ